MAKLPQLKKKVSAFLRKEDGKVSKDQLLKVGILATSFSFVLLPGVESHHDGCQTTGTHSDHCNTHTNNLSLSHTGTNAVGAHSHAVTDSSHASHASHSSHGQW